jgi:hypothetical protein
VTAAAAAAACAAVIMLSTENAEVEHVTEADVNREDEDEDGLSANDVGDPAAGGGGGRWDEEEMELDDAPPLLGTVEDGVTAPTPAEVEDAAAGAGEVVAAKAEEEEEGGEEEEEGVTPSTRPPADAEVGDDDGILAEWRPR